VRLAVTASLLLASHGIFPSGGAALVLTYPGETPGLNVHAACADDYWNRHPGGAQFLMADGAVRLLKEQTPLTALRALTTRGGGEILSNDSY
jgi:prepilin-type processing-associated H-X9-DG protein